MSKIVIALGGNALGTNLAEQLAALRKTAVVMADLIEAGHRLVICHGNGPQVGMIQNAFSAYHRAEPDSDVMPLSMCVAMSQGYIGYDLQNQLGQELRRRGSSVSAATVLTQIAVDPDDPAFRNPTKPIGAYMTEEEAKKLIAEKPDVTLMQNPRRGWRRVVASPLPQEIIEIDTIRTLLNSDHAVIAAGGGGIPVIRLEEQRLKGVSAVIDKDFASERLAEQVDADVLVILTAVEKVAINYGKENQQWLSHLTPAEVERYTLDGQFAPGSMLPKVQAAAKFAASRPGRRALITLLDKAGDGIEGRTGTVISL